MQFDEGDHPVSSTDARIMLRLLIAEAARFQRRQRKLQRSHAGGLSNPSASTTSIHSSSSSTSSSSGEASGGSFGSASSASSANSAGRREASDAKPLEHWERLLSQIDAAWWQSMGVDAEEKYQRIKARITTLLLWDIEGRGDLNYNRPPLEALEEMQRRHVLRLRGLPNGKLFHEEVVH